MDFIQAILGKYGMTRWRSSFQNLILRQYSLLFAEPEAVQPAHMVINSIHPVKQTHIHHTTYYPVTQVRTVSGTVNRMLHIAQSRHGAGISNPPSSPGHYEGEQSGGHSTAGRLSPIQVLQERVRKRQSREHLVTTVYRTENLAKSTVEPVAAQAAESNQERTAAPLRFYLPQMPGVAAAGRNLVERRTGSGLQPDSGDSRQRESITDKAAQYLPTARHQLQTMRSYMLTQGADTGTIDQPLRQKPEPGTFPYEQAGPPTMALKSNREAVSGSAGTAVEAQYSTPSLIFRPNSGPRSLARPVLHLGLGQKLAAALEKLESRQELLNPLLAEPGAIYRGLQPPSPRSLLPHGILSDLLSMVQQYDSAPLSGAAKPGYPGGRLSVAPKPGLLYTAKGLALPLAPQGRKPGSKLLTAGLEHEEYLQDAGSYSNLILRRPEAPKTARQEPVQQRLEPVLQAQAALLPSQAFAKAAPVAKMDSAELNQLAERVYQVLEKKMAIRKDRRGLR
ncbi:hypothetical protein GJB61_29915 [Paenibacillus sp. LC-T2]|uniref:Uncharacterized protein n=2 Tax=Paenibacillus monticola TaxID=2666075 RepID=A0A7X2L574_9BACL|nr:hypothetical protein [Paenibacillus monticola]